MPFTLKSSAFRSLDPIPKQYTCKGADRAPPLDWRDPPRGTKSLAMIVEDIDAPDLSAPVKIPRSCTGCSTTSRRRSAT